MKKLIQELIPHAPQMGLYVAPDLPADKVRNALGDYARDLRAEEVVALYDATLLGNAKDGAVFTADKIVFQNNDLSPAQTIKYADVIRVDAKKKLLGGRKVTVEVNRGRATVSLAIDFSARPDAAAFVARFLQEALLHGAAEEMDGARSRIRTSTGSDLTALTAALDALVERGDLSEEDYDALLGFVRSR